VGFVETPEGEIVAVSNVQEDAIAPDDGRRAAVARHRNFPGDVFFHRPFDGQVLLVADAVEAWTTPLRPVIGAGDSESHKQKSYDSETSHFPPPFGLFSS